jgi:hypothetical protein
MIMMTIKIRTQPTPRIGELLLFKNPGKLPAKMNVGISLFGA